MENGESMERQVWRIDRAGSLNRLHLKTETLVDPEHKEATISVKAVGLNFADIFACLGLYSATPKGSFIPGLEFAGIVEKCPNNSFQVGDHVMGVTRFGAYATRLNIDTRYLKLLPRSWSFAEGCAFPAQGATALYALKNLGGFQEGQTALVHSAAGGVGLFALDIIRKLGGHSIATIGSPEKKAFLARRAGLSENQILVRNEKTFARDLKTALSGRRLDVVLDSVGGEYFQPAFDIMGPGGRYILFGFASMMPQGKRPNYLKLAWKYLRRPRLDPLELISLNKTFSGFNLIWLWDRIDELSGLMDELLTMLDRPPTVSHRFGFENAKDAMILFQSGKTTGKVVLEI